MQLHTHVCARLVTNCRGVCTFSVGGSSRDGSLFWCSGDIMTCSFKDGVRHGDCTYTFFNRDTLNCRWIDGRCAAFESAQRKIIESFGMQTDTKAHKHVERLWERGDGVGHLLHVECNPGLISICNSFKVCDARARVCLYVFVIVFARVDRRSTSLLSCSCVQKAGMAPQSMRGMLHQPKLANTYVTPASIPTPWAPLLHCSSQRHLLRKMLALPVKTA